jgi:glycosyltransferase involved in cell wall biosynthesis
MWRCPLSSPLVSVVMPTYNRAKYVPTAIRCFSQQGYWNKEMIIVDDGTETLTIPADARISYIKLDRRTTTGEKRNIGARRANGQIIANWDDDDWSHPHRLEDEVQRLFKTRKMVTGYNASVIYDEATGNFHKINAGPPYFASGSSQCYWKYWWERHPYPDCSFGEDSVFARTARLADELAIAEPGQMLVVRRHATNTSDVFVPRLPRLTKEDISPEFFLAIEREKANLDYMWEPHLCTEQCRVMAALQYAAEVVDYRVTSLPEVGTR